MDSRVGRTLSVGCLILLLSALLHIPILEVRGGQISSSSFNLTITNGTFNVASGLSFTKLHTQSDKVTLSATDFWIPIYSGSKPTVTVSTFSPKQQIQWSMTGDSDATNYIRMNVSSLPAYVQIGSTIIDSPYSTKKDFDAYDGSNWYYDSANSRIEVKVKHSSSETVLVSWQPLGGTSPSPGGPAPTPSITTIGPLTVGLLESKYTLTIGQSNEITIPISWSGPTDIIIRNIQFLDHPDWYSVLTTLPALSVAEVTGAKKDIRVRVDIPSDLQEGVIFERIMVSADSATGASAIKTEVLNLQLQRAAIITPQIGGEVAFYALGALLAVFIIAGAFKSSERRPKHTYKPARRSR